MSRNLQANHAKRVTGILAPSPNIATQPVEASYLVFVHSDAEADIRDLAGFKHVSEYGSRKPVSPHEIGSCENFRFITSPELAPYAAAGASVGSTGLSGTTNIDVYGLLDKGYRDRRAAMMDAQRFKPGARTALAALLKEQSAQGDREAQAEQSAADRGFRQGENALDRGLRSQELMARMDDSAATRQLRAQELQDNILTNAARREAAGVETAIAKQMADLRSQYLNAKTDAERNDAARKLQALSGKADTSLKDNFMVVGGGQEWDANAMAMRNVPQQLIDLRTGRPVTGGQQSLPPLAQNPQAIAIKNDSKLSIEQKREALRQLGYQ